MNQKSDDKRLFFISKITKSDELEQKTCIFQKKAVSL